MSDNQQVGFSPSVNVSIMTVTDTVYVGRIVGEIGERHTQNLFVLAGGTFVLIRLTIAVGPYAVGDIAAINLDLIESIGPVSIA